MSPRLTGRSRTLSIEQLLGMETDEIERDTCRMCGDRIRMQIRRGTGYCSGRCEAEWAIEQQAMADYATGASEREPT